MENEWPNRSDDLQMGSKACVAHCMDQTCD